MQAAALLFSQGFGTRRACAALCESGALLVGGRVIDDRFEELDLAEGEPFQLSGRTWPYHAKALVLLHKPAGYECSNRPGAHPSVMTLLPSPLRLRPGPGKTVGVQAVGRLDVDTTGALLLTDDGALLHRLTSPKHHVPKVYDVSAKHPVSDLQIARLLEGVVLREERKEREERRAGDERDTRNARDKLDTRDILGAGEAFDARPVRALAAERTDDRSLQLTLGEGKYHQVKRMLAAVGNRCEALHRSAIGGLKLPDDLAPGQWRWVDASWRSRIDTRLG